jgi:hypothetical protein
MRKLQTIIAAALTAFTLLVPSVALAQANANANKPAVKPAAKQDTCGDLQKQFDEAGGGKLFENAPKYCSVEALYTKFINTALFFIGIVGVIALIYGGYLYMTARGNEAQVKKGRQVLTWAIVGVIVVIAAAVIVNVVVKALVENRFV